MRSLAAYVTALARKHKLRAAVVVIGLAAVVYLGLESVRCLQARHHYRAAIRSFETSSATGSRQAAEEALEEIRRALAIWPRSTASHLLAARVARRLQRYDEASARLQRCQELGLSPETLDLEWGKLRVQQGMLAPSESVLLGHVIRDDGEAESALEALASGYMQTYELPRALKCLDGWLEKRPENTQALRWRAAVQARLSRARDAAADYGRLVQLDPVDDDARQKLVTILLNAHETKEALEHLEVLERRRPQDSAVLVGLARCRIELGQAGQGEKLLDRVLAREPDNPDALSLRGQVALDAGRAVDAEPCFRRALARSPYDRQIVYNFYRCLEKLGRHEEAKQYQTRLRQIETDMDRLKALRSSVMANPRDPEPRCETGRILMHNGQEREAVRWLQSALQADPGHQPSRRLLEEFYQRDKSRQLTDGAGSPGRETGSGTF